MSSAASARRVAIIGGGIAGLATAYELNRRSRQARPSVEFILYEASDRLGGIVETVRRDGFVVECGPDAWVTEKPWARELAIELGLESEILSSDDAQRRTLILQGGELVPMPDGMRMMVPADLSAIARSSLFTEEAKRSYHGEPGRAAELKAAAPDADESVAAFVRRHFGEEVADRIAGPLLSGVFGGSIERLSVRSVMPAFVKMEREHGSLIVALQAREKASPAATRAIFTSLKSGLGTLVDAMAATVPAEAIRIDTEVLSIAREGACWLVKTADATESFDAVVVATPPHVTRRMLAPMIPQLGELLDIDASSAIVVALAFEGQDATQIRIPQGFGFLAPPSAERESAVVSLQACTFVDQKFRFRVPEGGVLLRAFYGGKGAARMLDQTDASLVTSASEELASILGSLPEPMFTVVRRWPRSLPQYEVGHENRVAEIERLTAGIAGLHLAGNAYHGVGLPDLIRDGRAIASRVLN